MAKMVITQEVYIAGELHQIDETVDADDHLREELLGLKVAEDLPEEKNEEE